MGIYISLMEQFYLPKSSVFYFQVVIFFTFDGYYDLSIFIVPRKKLVDTKVKFFVLYDF